MTFFEWLIYRFTPEGWERPEEGFRAEPIEPQPITSDNSSHSHKIEG
jgi:hypothetical protein